MSDVSKPGWWQASDGRWYPPEEAGPTTTLDRNRRTAPAATGAAAGGPTAQPSLAGPGGFVSFLGWVTVLAGLAVAISILVELNDEAVFFDPNAGDYLIALSPAFLVIGVGASAAALGHIATRITSAIRG